LTLTVCDNGIGITPEVLPGTFDLSRHNAIQRRHRRVVSFCNLDGVHEPPGHGLSVEI
jgi:signal transduction histidine kinase